ncbi:hypothetical protein GOV10_04655 [Candidatus Woesearchaeota archaeon]|nr:hypothetical protein [Candidatus Woesearchaeota archaeon]
MTRVKECDWKLREELENRRGSVSSNWRIFFHKICAVCGDSVIHEKMWKVRLKNNGTKHKFLCSDCASTWEEAYDKANDGGNDKEVYSSSSY